MCEDREEAEDVTYVDVTRDNYPSVYEALDYMSVVGGESKGHSTYSVRTKWERWLNTFEKDLEVMSEPERFTFLLGADKERHSIMRNRCCFKLNDFVVEFKDG